MKARFKHYENDKDTNYVKIFKHLRTLKNCTRLNSHLTIQPYNVAVHCYYTGILFEILSDLCDINVSKKEIIYVYRHDILESITGDVLYPAKHFDNIVDTYWTNIENRIIDSDRYEYLSFYNNVKTFFNEDTWSLFKTCDILELFLFCKEEKTLGNSDKAMLHVYANCEEHLLNNVPEPLLFFVKEFMYAD
ncbi:MAG: HD domain-containing protein [Candidatus Lokiarchaeota archaeon]